MRCLVCLVAALTLTACPAISQENGKTWEERKAERFAPLSEQTRDEIAAAVPRRATAKPRRPRKILCFYRCEGFIHTSIPHGNLAVREMARQTDAFDVDLADDYDVFTRQNLKQYDCILLNNASQLHFPTAAHHNAFLDFIAGGKGLVGFHAASDSFGRHPESRAFVGGQFSAHPWGAGGTWAFKLDDPEHVLNRAFGGHGFWHRDEIYQYKPDTYQGPEVLRLLVSLDMTKNEVSSQIDDGPREVPVSWIRRAGDGRVFYTNFGHREETFSNRVILQHMLDGIQFALGDLDADARPTAAIARQTPAFAPVAP